MRQFTITQDIETGVDHHWQLFVDEAFDRALHLEGLRFASYEYLERDDSASQYRRTVKANPKLDLPGPVARLFGDGFGYVEAGTFDKATQIWRAITTPNMLSGKLRGEATVRVESNGSQRCRRICELVVEAKVLAIGGLVESSLEKNMRSGWAASAAHMNRWLAAARDRP